MPSRPPSRPRQRLPSSIHKQTASAAIISGSSPTPVPPLPARSTPPADRQRAPTSTIIGAPASPLFQPAVILPQTPCPARSRGGMKPTPHSVRALSGKIPWADLLADAITYARHGVPVSSHQALRGPIDFNPDDAEFGNLQRFEEARKHFCHPDGTPLRCGDIMRQVDLAEHARRHRQLRAHAPSIKAKPRERSKRTAYRTAASSAPTDFRGTRGQLGRADLRALSRSRRLQSSAEHPRAWQHSAS